MAAISFCNVQCKVFVFAISFLDVQFIKRDHCVLPEGGRHNVVLFIVTQTVYSDSDQSHYISFLLEKKL